MRIGETPEFMTDIPTAKTPTFEEAMEELERLVHRMEEGELTLEESIEAYTRGTELVRLCRTKLDDAEARVNKLDAEQNSRNDSPASE